MRKQLILVSALFLALTAKAQYNVLVNNSGNTMYASPVSSVESISFDSTYSKFQISGASSTLNIQKDFVESLTFSTSTVNLTKIYIIWNGTDDATIINPYSDQGVTITATGGNVTVTATSGIADLEYNLLGTSTSGYLSMSSDQPANFVVNNLNLTNASGPAIQVTGSQTHTFTLQSGTTNTLSDGSSSTKNGALQTAGAIVFNGTGTLGITGVKKHGISTSSTITVNSGNLTINSAASDGLHSEGFTMTDGAVTVTSSTGDGIDAGDAAVAISGGTINVTSTSSDVKAIKTGSNTITISGGTIGYTVSGAASKGISAKGNVTFSGGTMSGTMSGAAVLTASGSGYDPSYSSAVKSDAGIYVNGGTFNYTIASTADGGKAFSADGEIIVTDGNVTVNTAGANGTYTNTDGVSDTYSSSAFSTDTDFTISGGTVNLTVSGKDGKGINVDGAANINGGTITINNSGAEGNGIKADGILTVAGGTTNVTLSGAAVLTASGSGYDASYPSALNSSTQILVNSGNVTVTGTTAATGARGFSSDGTIDINGGTVNITLAGSGATYTNTTGVADSYSSSALKSDGNINITAGSVTTTSTGNAGKGINSDGAVTIGSSTTSPTLNIKTSGSRILVSGTDYAHPKTLVANGAIIINSGTNTFDSTDDGVHSDTSITINGGTNTISAVSTVSGVGEGIEAPIINLAGGTNNVNASNDGINATYGTVAGGTESNDGSQLNISGGINIIVGKDAIDSNGNITITGGTTIANGPTSSPEEAVDYNGTFNINGGIFMAAGSNANMTKAMSTTSTQVGLYLKSSAQLSTSSVINIQNASGTEMVTFKPKNAVYYFHYSSPSLAQGTQYKVYFGGTYTGGSYVGGTSGWGVYTGGTYSSSGATLKSTFTTSTSSKVNTVSF